MTRKTSYKLPILLGTLLWLFCGCKGDSDQNGHSSNNTFMDTEKLIIGTYTNNGPDASKGIYLVSRNTKTGKLSFDSLLTEIENPTFQAVSPDGKYVYSVSETPDKGGAVYAYAIEPDHSLRKINEQPSLGRSACHVALNSDQTMLFVANYSSGVFTVYHLDKDGSISEPVQHYEYEGSGPHPNQGSSHPHQTALSPDEQFVYVPDLGTDKIHMYRINLDARTLEDLNPAAFRLPPGSGPRHMTFHPDQPFAYVINELNNTVQAMRYNAKTGELSGIDIYSTLPDDFEEVSYCADIHISPDGKFLYGSNRGHNSLVIFEINREDGRLSLVGHTSVNGDWPRNFHISEDGKNVYVGNQKTGNISSYSRDADSGELTLLDSSFLETYAPVCITQVAL